MRARLFLIDDPVARDWLPFSLTRPAGELLFGTRTLRARAERVWSLTCEGHLAGDALLDFEEPGAPPCVNPEEIGAEGDKLLLCSRFACDGRGEFDTPTLLTDGSEPVGAWIPHGTPPPPSLQEGRWPRWPRAAVEGTLLASPWELMKANGARIRTDAQGLPDHDLPLGSHRVGLGRVSVGEDATIEPGAVFDTTDGPVILAAEARVQAPCRLAGPLYVGPRSTVLGGVVKDASIGPGCKVRGEVESSVLAGFANKAHDGFLGHSVVGRWVNLGAMTTNSDLKNTYGAVRSSVGGRAVETGLTKAGCLLGDHVRTGIGTLLNTGAVVGAASSVFGGGMPPRDVPPFSWVARRRLAEYDIDRFLETAARVMARRGVDLTAGMRRLYRRAFADTASLRSALDPP